MPTRTWSDGGTADWSARGRLDKSAGGRRRTQFTRTAPRLADRRTAVGLADVWPDLILTVITADRHPADAASTICVQCVQNTLQSVQLDVNKTRTGARPWNLASRQGSTEDGHNHFLTKRTNTSEFHPSPLNLFSYSLLFSSIISFFFYFLFPFHSLPSLSLLSMQLESLGKRCKFLQRVRTTNIFQFNELPNERHKTKTILSKRAVKYEQ